MKLFVLALAQALCWALVVSQTDLTSHEPRRDEIDVILEEMTADGPRPPLVGVHVEELQRYLDTPGRKYSIVALFTYGPSEWRCALCAQAYLEFETLASSYQNQPTSQNLFFVVVDMADMKKPNNDELDAPMIFLFPHDAPPKTPPHAYSLLILGPEAETVSRWLSRFTDGRINIVRRFRYGRYVYLTSVALVLARLLSSRGLHWRHVIQRRIIAYAAVMFCLVVTAGGVKSSVLAKYTGSMHVDVAVIAAMQGAVVYGMILIAESKGGPCQNKKPCNPTGTNKQGAIGIAMMCIFFSFYMSLYRYVSGEYPFRFLIP